jgi:uncharacterized protein YdeI (YjbR/CyaY-like superfamily)
MIKASSRSEWRAWLADNHAIENEVWLVYFKKHTGKPSVTYMESVKEALCFGWIDGIKKSIDDETYMHRFTPRKPGSKWSPLNINLAGELIEAGQMTEAGLKAFEQRQEYDDELLKAIKSKDIPLSPEIEKRLKANQKAWDYFNQLAPGYRRQYVGWLQGAKRSETTEKRLKEAIELLASNKKLGMK